MNVQLGAMFMRVCCVWFGFFILTSTIKIRLLFSELAFMILIVTILFNHSDSRFVSIYWVTEESV